MKTSWAERCVTLRTEIGIHVRGKKLSRKVFAEQYLGIGETALVKIEAGITTSPIRIVRNTIERIERTVKAQQEIERTAKDARK